jgi:hypothetical protein
MSEIAEFVASVFQILGLFAIVAVFAVILIFALMPVPDAPKAVSPGILPWGVYRKMDENRSYPIAYFIHSQTAKDFIDWYVTIQPGRDAKNYFVKHIDWK